MRVSILATQWGFESLQFEDFIIKIKTAGFDGIETGVPEQAGKRKDFIRLLNEYRLPIVCNQLLAKGNTIGEFCKSFEYYLNLCMECNPVLINSHSGRDYFSINEQLKVIDVAAEFAVKNNIRVVHETHRGRLGFSPYNAKELFDMRPEMKITADLSHWVCVTESYLENCTDILSQAIACTEHIHARVGHTQGPQVPDPRTAEWQYATNIFINWWTRILEHKRMSGESVITITPEFGPPPYMPTNPSTGKPLAVQFELNCFIKDLIRDLPILNRQY
ncbi:MAG: sugar phosphate isomerase/epimerase family protein [Sphingobacteriales bacterium]